MKLTLFRIDGYWKEDKETFEDYLVAQEQYDESIPDEVDEQIFFYGLDEDEIIKAIVLDEDWGEDFVITAYSRY